MNHLKMTALLLAAALVASLCSACAPREPGQSSQPTDPQAAAPDNTQMPTVSSEGTVGQFTTQDVNGNSVTQDIFAEHKLTMVNIFTTWCSPCVGEMPDLEKLHQQVADRDVGVVGVVLDVLDPEGNIVQEDLEQAQLLVEKTGVTYPILLPDSTYFNGRLAGIEAVPETFFVDQNGKIAGGTYVGSRSLEDWLEVVEYELAALEVSA